LPLRLRGSTTLDSATHLWVVLAGNRGQFWLQFPQVKIQNGQWSVDNVQPWVGIRAVLQNGKWSVENVQPRGGIRAMLVLRVGEQGNKVFAERAARNEWQEFAHLPIDAEEVATVALDPVPQCLQFDARSCLR
jgi:hypothetical protein